MTACKRGHVNPKRDSSGTCLVCKAARNSSPEGLRRQREYNAKYRARNKEKLKAYYREWRKTPAGRRRSRRGNWQSSGINVLDAERALAAHNGRCDICLIGSPGKTCGWHVDHDHVTKKVRGVLCTNCNRGLGHLKDSPTILRAAAEYLENANA